MTVPLFKDLGAFTHPLEAQSSHGKLTSSYFQVNFQHYPIVCQFYTFDHNRPNVEISDASDLVTPNVEYSDPRTYRPEVRNLPIGSMFWTWGFRKYGGGWWPVLEPFFSYRKIAFLVVPVLDYIKRKDVLKPNTRAAVRMTNDADEAGM
ncbi:hypothetical protein TWF694_001473 [Orbilia ellipsospora]|uniref:Uncharacterized protein n=1 Tax=Orbilia ellipsospora TaxID=2528407 RepID=A0AAV9XRR7_9PEZI